MLAIAGGKGGCGKTTTALGLAVGFARAGRDPLVVDADSDMPDVHHFAGVDRTPGADALAADGKLECVRQRSTALPGVGVITAGSREALDAALETVRGWHGPVLVDCPGGAGRDAARPLRHAEATVLVATDDPRCLVDTERTAAVATSLEAPPLGVVVREGGSAPPELDGRRVLGRVPTVDGAVFEDPRVLDRWTAISKRIIGSTRRARNDRPAR